jgi:hypothetical protein
MGIIGSMVRQTNRIAGRYLLHPDVEVVFAGANVIEVCAE